MLIRRFRNGKGLLRGNAVNPPFDRRKFVVARPVWIRKGDATEPFSFQWNLLAGLVCRAL